MLVDGGVTRGYKGPHGARCRHLQPPPGREGPSLPLHHLPPPSLLLPPRPLASSGNLWGRVLRDCSERVPSLPGSHTPDGTQGLILGGSCLCCGLTHRCASLRGPGLCLRVSPTAQPESLPVLYSLAGGLAPCPWTPCLVSPRLAAPRPPVPRPLLQSPPEILAIKCKIPVGPDTGLCRAGLRSLGAGGKGGCSQRAEPIGREGGGGQALGSARGGAGRPGPSQSPWANRRAVHGWTTTCPRSCRVPTFRDTAKGYRGTGIEYIPV